MAFEKLQKQLLKDILKGEHTIRNVYEGIGKIRTILCCKKGSSTRRGRARRRMKSFPLIKKDV